MWFIFAIPFIGLGILALVVFLSDVFAPVLIDILAKIIKVIWPFAFSFIGVYGLYYVTISIQNLLM